MIRAAQGGEGRTRIRILARECTKLNAFARARKPMAGDYSFDVKYRDIDAG